MADFDVIVIGAGNGGLAAATALARRGASVMLLERHNVPGGCATSFIRGRFEFETALHQLSGLGTPEAPGPLRGVFQQLGVLDAVEFVEEDTLYRAIVPGTLSLTLKADKEEIVRALSDAFPAEAPAVRTFVDLVWEFCRQMISVRYLRDPDASREKYPLYCAYALKTSAEVLDAHFSDPLLKLAVAAYWGYAGLPPSRLSFADLAVLLWVYADFKPFHMKGGSQALSNALLDSFLRAGGTARFNCAAAKLLLNGGGPGGRVAGVRTEAGDEITAKQVISNAGVVATYRDLMAPDEVPPEQRAMLGSRTIGPSGFSVYCGLDCTPADLGFDVSTQFISLNADMDRHYALWRTLDPPESCGMTCYDVADPSFSPDGACQVVLVTLQYADHWYAVAPDRYAETKYRFADGLLDIAESLHPGFRDALEEVEVSTPLTHLRYLGHPGGAIYGFDQYAKDSNLFISPLSGIEGLWFAGAWVGMGGFQPALESGMAAAKAAFRTLDRRGDL